VATDVIRPVDTVEGFAPFNYLARDFKRVIDDEEDLPFATKLGLYMVLKIMDEVISENRKSSKDRKSRTG